MNAIRAIHVSAVTAALMFAASAVGQESKPAAKDAKHPAKEAKMPAKNSEAGADNQKKMMEAMQKMGEVRPEHKQLAFFTGEWKATTTMYMDPKAPPEKTEGKTHTESKFGGRYIEMHYEGKFQGQTFNGEGVMGFDNLKGKFFNTWIDSMSTGFWLAWGTYDKASNTYTFHGSMDDPMAPATQMKVREVIHPTDEKHYTFEWYEMHNGKEAKTLQIDYAKD
jgi:hypothetical protein